MSATRHPYARGHSGISRRRFNRTIAKAGILASLGPGLAAYCRVVQAEEIRGNLPDLVTMSGAATDMMAHVEKDKWNLVMLWSVTCGICARETPKLSNLYDDVKGTDITILGLSIDGVAQTGAVKQWMQANEMRFPNLIGEFNSVALNFEALTKEPLRGTPTFLMFDPTGALAAVNPGPVRPQAVRDFVARRRKPG